MLLHVFGHVKANQRRVTGKEKVGQRTSQLGFPNAGRPKKDKTTHGSVGRLEARTRAADGPCERRDRQILANHPTMQVLLHVEEFLLLILVDRGERHAGPLRDDLVDFGLSDLYLTPTRLNVELLAHEPEVLARQHLLLTEELCPLVVLVSSRVLHLLDGDPNALVDLAELLAVPRFTQLGASAGLVHEINCLVGQEPIGDVAARLVDSRLHGLLGIRDAMKRLVSILHAQQDVQGLGLSWRLNLDGLEPTLQRPVLLDVLAVLRWCRSPDTADLSPATVLA